MAIDLFVFSRSSSLAAMTLVEGLKTALVAIDDATYTSDASRLVVAHQYVRSQIPGFPLSGYFDTVERLSTSASVDEAGEMLLIGDHGDRVGAEGAPPPIIPTIEAPVVRTLPTITPSTDVFTGDSVTLFLGTYAGVPAPTVSWVLRLDGVNVTTQVDPFLAYETTQSGLLELTVTVTNAGGSLVRVATVTVQDSVQPPAPIDYNSLAFAYFDADTAYGGTAAAVTSISMEGTGRVVTSLIGTGASITHGTTGFRFTDGAYMQSPNTLTPAATDGWFILAEVTPHAYGSGSGSVFEVAGKSSSVIRNSAGNWQISLNTGASSNTNVGAVAYGAKVIIGVEVDDLLDQVRIRRASGPIMTVVNAATDPDFNTVRLGRFLNATIHRLALVTRREGQAWPLTFEDAIADFQTGV